ncbi:unnamed protein product, partial [Polarella glacialis]
AEEGCLLSRRSCFPGEQRSGPCGEPAPWDAGEVFYLAVTRMMPYSQGLWGNSTEHTADGSLKRQILSANSQRSEVDKPGVAFEADAATISLDETDVILDESDDEPLLGLA